MKQVFHVLHNFNDKKQYILCTLNLKKVHIFLPLFTRTWRIQWRKGMDNKLYWIHFLKSYTIHHSPMIWDKCLKPVFLYEKVPACPKANWYISGKEKRFAFSCRWCHFWDLFFCCFTVCRWLATLWQGNTESTCTVWIGSINPDHEPRILDSFVSLPARHGNVTLSSINWPRMHSNSSIFAMCNKEMPKFIWIRSVGKNTQ